MTKQELIEELDAIRIQTADQETAYRLGLVLGQMDDDQATEYELERREKNGAF